MYDPGNSGWFLFSSIKDSLVQWAKNYQSLHMWCLCLENLRHAHKNDSYHSDSFFHSCSECNASAAMSLIAWIPLFSCICCIKLSIWDQFFSTIRWCGVGNSASYKSAMRSWLPCWLNWQYQCFYFHIHTFFISTAFFQLSLSIALLFHELSFKCW